MLRHMAACADCREIVFLALPHVEAKQEAIAKTRVRWMQWPALRWGAVAACALVVGAAVTLHRQPRSEMAAPAVAGTGSDRDAMASKTSSATSRPADRVVMNDRKDDTEKASDNFAKSQAVNPTFAMRNSHSEARREYSPPQLAKTTPVPALGFSNSDALSKLDTRPRSSRDVDRRGEKRDEVASSLARNAPSAPPAANAEPATGKAKEPLSKNEMVAEAKKSAPANEQGETASGGLVLAPRWTLSADEPCSAPSTPVQRGRRFQLLLTRSFVRLQPSAMKSGLEARRARCTTPRMRAIIGLRYNRLLQADPSILTSSEWNSRIRNMASSPLLTGKPGPP